MAPTDVSNELRKHDKAGALTDDIRSRAHDLCKTFKTSWVQLGQILYTVYRDKLYYGWGYEKLEDYTARELGFKKQLAMRMLKSYLFLEQDEPAYLDKNFSQMREAPRVPSLDAVNVLRLAKAKRELLAQDYQQLKKAVFDKGKDATVVRKELTALMKERKPVDPDEEREKRNEAAIRKLIGSLRLFQKDMTALKLIPHEVVEQAEGLMERLNRELP